jgi:DNA repair protein SbcD/Mre11
MRFLHLADIHLDTPFVGRSASLRQRLRRATRDAFARGLEHAAEAEVHAVLIAGDLLDGSVLSLETEHFLLDQVHALNDRGIPLFYATGNHDPGTPESPARQLPWPPNVHVFADDVPRTVPVFRHEPRGPRGERAGPVGTVTGIGHATGREGRDLSKLLTPPSRAALGPDCVPAVALLHSQVMGAGRADDHDRYAPSTLDHLRGAGFDYWALGHIHLPQRLEELPGIWYPGNPQGRSPRETGARGGLLVEIARPGARPHATPVPLGRVRWEVLELTDLDAVGDVRTLVDRVRTQWIEARRADPGLPGTEWIVRIELRGPSPLARRFDSGEARDDLERILLAALGEGPGLLDVEVRHHALQHPISVDGLRSRPDAVGEVFRLLDEVTADGPDAAAVLRMLGLGPRDLVGIQTDDPVALAGYIRELLDGADRWLAHRFTENGGTGR